MEGARSRWIVAGGKGVERRKTVEFMGGIGNGVENSAERPPETSKGSNIEFVDGHCQVDNIKKYINK